MFNCRIRNKQKNYQGGSKQNEQDYSDVRMYANGSSLDPVSGFKFYLQKINPKCDALFQLPEKNYSKTGIWYKAVPMGKNTLSKMMQNISKKAGLSREYTNHCVRASTVTALYQAGVDSHQICLLTKHKNENSLKHYINGSTSEQKRHCSSVLANVFGGESSEVVGITPASSEQIPVPSGSANIYNANVNARTDSTAVSSFLSNCSFNNCVINLAVRSGATTD